MSETLRTREIELLNEIRNINTDPSSRGTSQTDTFSGDGTTTTFTLKKNKVKYISSITVDGDNKYIGYDYSLSLGEGSDYTTITFNTAPGTGTDNIEITYLYGTTMIYEGFQRLDSELPRISIIYKGAYPEYMAIGESGDFDSAKHIWYIATYTAEVRSRYAKQLKSILNNFAVNIAKLRQKNPQLYKILEIKVISVVPYDFDNELRLYRGQVSYRVKCAIQFKD